MLRVLFGFSLIFILLSNASCEKLGVLVDGFDPVTRFHVQELQKAKKKLNLDAIYLFLESLGADASLAADPVERYRMIQMLAMRYDWIKVVPRLRMQRIMKNHGNYVQNLKKEMKDFGEPDFSFLVEKSNSNLIGDLKSENPILLNDFFESKTKEEYYSNKLMDSKLDYIHDFVRRNRLYKTSGLNDLRIPQIIKMAARSGYHGTLKVAKGDEVVNFRNYSVAEVCDVNTLNQALTLDFDAYFKSKLPDFIYQLLRRTNRVSVIASMGEQAESILASQGYKWYVHFKKRSGKREYEYLVTQDKQGYRIHISNFLGSTRMSHLVMQLAGYLTRFYMGLEQFEIVGLKEFGMGTKSHYQNALNQLRPHEDDLIIMGYKGAFKHSYSDIVKFLGQSNSKLTEADEFKLFKWMDTHAHEVVEPKKLGNEYLTFDLYKLPLLLSSRRIFVFRNLYGDQSGNLVEVLIEKGFRKFVFFGNAGGLSERVNIGSVYAPDIGGETGLENFAGLDYGLVNSGSVKSILAESWEWKDRFSELLDVVDVESEHIIKALKCPRCQIYYGLLVSDKPGDEDITLKNEDKKSMILAKRAFFLKALQAML